MGEWSPIAYELRSVTTTEQCYSQIAKEALAIAWACEQFIHYLLGFSRQIISHWYHLSALKLLMSYLACRTLRFRLCLMPYYFHIVHVPGQSLITTDALSRAPVSSALPCDTALQTEVTTFFASATDSSPASDKCLKPIQSHQVSDEICMQYHHYILFSWLAILTRVTSLT